jgi:hypothetical protein
MADKTDKANKEQVNGSRPDKRDPGAHGGSVSETVTREHEPSVNQVRHEPMPASPADHRQQRPQVHAKPHSIPAVHSEETDRQQDSQADEAADRD